MSPARGVRARLVRSTALITAGAMALMLVVVLLVANRLAASQVETSLDDRIDTVAGSLRVERGRVVPPTGRSDANLDGVWVFADDGALLAGPDSSERTARTVAGLSDVREPRTLRRGERLFRARPLVVPGRPDGRAVAVATESLDVYEGSRNILLGALAVAGLLLVAGTAAATRWTVSRTLRPVAEMTEAAEDWSAHDLEARFAPTGDDELARLGRTLDRLLDRVAHAIRSEQRLTGELAHELRTPLTAIRGETELALMTDLPPEVRDRFDRVLDQVDRLSGTITALLDLARHESGPQRRADAGEVVADLVHARPATAVRLDVVAAAGLEVGFAAELLERTVAPVLDNAVRHARTQVDVVVRGHGDRVLVEVRDDGPGLAPDRVDEVFGVGVRGGGDGTGLGLALARRVARTVGGAVEVTSPSDPTVFTIDLPRT